MSAITVGGDLIHYEVLGRGRPVVLVHGWIGSWRYWIPTMQHLHMRYRVYALDLFGYGDSGKNPQRYTVQQQVDMLDEFMDQLAIPKAAFIGHGLGAMILSEFAFTRPDRVPRLMLVSAPLFDIPNLKHRDPLRKKIGSDAGVAGVSATSLSAEATIPSAGMMRQALLERAAVRNRYGRNVLGGDHTAEEEESGPKGNLLVDSIKTTKISDMLDRCFKPSDIEYNKLHSDVTNTDDRVLMKSIAGFDAGRMLDTVKQLDMQTVIVHGEDDPLLPALSDAVRDYVTSAHEYEDKERSSDDDRSVNPALKDKKDNPKLALNIEDVRHFPMLENERFGRFVLDFLETREVSKLEEGIKGRWKRRSR